MNDGSCHKKKIGVRSRASIPVEKIDVRSVRYYEFHELDGQRRRDLKAYALNGRYVLKFNQNPTEPSQTS
ncbi:MAG TPA: hypothetical protein VI750_08560, partial [Pyrinomonadaceae bacterium]|nr:hypothetical protein [Pyrinomonadaceae bacterium]